MGDKTKQAWSYSFPDLGKAGMGVGKVEQVASIDALSIPPPVSGNQYDVMLSLSQHLYKRRG